MKNSIKKNGLRFSKAQQTAMQKSLQEAPDYFVPKKPRKVKPAVCAK